MSESASDRSGPVFSQNQAENRDSNENLPQTVRVLDVGEPSREVAQLLSLETQSTLPKPGERPVVLVVSDPTEVDTLLDVEDQSWIGCVIAWRLPEESVERLFQLGVSVFVGLPPVEDLLRAIEYLPDRDEAASFRSYAARLSVIEKLLINSVE